MTGVQTCALPISERGARDRERDRETNDNKNTMIQNLWDTAKAVLRRKFIPIESYLKKQEKSNFTPKGTREKNKQNPKLVEGKKS